MKPVNIWQERFCLVHFARLANTLLKDEESTRDNYVLLVTLPNIRRCNFFSLSDSAINRSKFGYQQRCCVTCCEFSHGFRIRVRTYSVSHNDPTVAPFFGPPCSFRSSLCIARRWRKRSTAVMGKHLRKSYCSQ